MDGASDLKFEVTNELGGATVSNSLLALRYVDDARRVDDGFEEFNALPAPWYVDEAGLLGLVLL